MNLIGDSFVFHGSIYPKVKFWGKSVEFKPQGVCTLKFPEWEDEAYTWSNVSCIIHNVIVGTLWMEHHGTMEIVNHKTKAKCVLNFKQGGYPLLLTTQNSSSCIFLNNFESCFSPLYCKQ
jgi:hypothetical protein